MNKNLINEKHQQFGYHSTSYYALAKMLESGKFKCSTVNNDDLDKSINNNYKYFISTHNTKFNTIDGYDDLHGKDDIYKRYDKTLDKFVLDDISNFLPVTLKINFENLSKDFKTNNISNTADSEYKNKSTSNSDYRVGNNIDNNIIDKIRNYIKTNPEQYTSLRKKIKSVQYNNLNKQKSVENDKTSDLDLNNITNIIDLIINNKSLSTKEKEDLLTKQLGPNIDISDILHENKYEYEDRVLLNQEYLDINNNWIPECHILINNYTIKGLIIQLKDITNLLKAFSTIILYATKYNRKNLKFYFYDNSTKFMCLQKGSSDINDISELINKYVLSNLIKSDFNKEDKLNWIKTIINILNEINPNLKININNIINNAKSELHHGTKSSDSLREIVDYYLKRNKN